MYVPCMWGSGYRKINTPDSLGFPGPFVNNERTSFICTGPGSGLVGALPISVKVGVVMQVLLIKSRFCHTAGPSDRPAQPPLRRLCLYLIRVLLFYMYNVCECIFGSIWYVNTGRPPRFVKSRVSTLSIVSTPFSRSVKLLSHLLVQLQSSDIALSFERPVSVSK